MQVYFSYWIAFQRLVYYYIVYYEYLLRVQISQVVEGEFFVIIYNYFVIFGDVVYLKFSSEIFGYVRAYDETYETIVSCKVYLTCMVIGAKYVQYIYNLVKMSVMVRVSLLCQGIGECEKDFGGYFIVKGKERIIISYIYIAYNIFIIMYCIIKKILVCEMRTYNEITGNNLLVKVRLM